MTTTTLTPFAVTSSYGTLTYTGGFVADGIFADASDATYVQLGEPPVALRFSLSSFTLGTGRVKYWTVSVRTRGFNATSYPLLVKMLRAAGAVVWPQSDVMLTQIPTTHVTAAFVPPSLTQAEIDDLEVQFDWLGAGVGSGPVNIYEVSVAVTWATIPVANVTYPTGAPALGTSSPTVTWTHTPGSDGGPQSAYEVKAFTAAQYTAGGFSPDTSAAAYFSGVLTGSANSLTIGPLANNTTFRVYVRTAQQINGAAHWSAWDYEGFSTNYTPSTVQTVTTVADNDNGRLTVTVNRLNASAAWVSVELERTDDGGTTWVPVRGATGVKATNTHTTAWAANAVTVRDDEAGNGTTVTYRARATTSTGVVGDWTSSTPTSWVKLGVVWLKDPHSPALNVAIDVSDMPQPTRTVPQGIHNVIGASQPVVVSDVRQSRVGTFEVLTRSNAESTAFETATTEPVKLLQFPAAHLWGSRYIALSETQELHLSPSYDSLHRRWQVGYIEVDRPADQTVY